MMKKTILLVVGVMAIGVAFVGTLSTQANGNPSQEATVAATNYLQALKDGNATEAVKYVEDSRYKSEADTIQGYKDLLKTDPISDAKVLSTQVVDSKHANVNVQFTSNVAGTQTVVLQVEEKGNTWKVEIKQVKAVKPNKNK